MCDAVGGDSLLVVAREDTEEDYETNFENAQRLLADQIPAAKRLGIDLLVENVRASFLRTAEETARFIESLKKIILAG